MADADLVLEGGGVKAPGIVGAITALVDRPNPYTFHRVAGTSAGAIVGAMLAAGITASDMAAMIDELDFTRLEDEPSVFKHFPVAGEAIGLLFNEGMFIGEVLREWIADTLAAHGVHTWGDLRDDDPGSALRPERRYKLAVIVSDVSRGRMLRLPWDYRSLLGVDPDEQSVADAVRASASLPFYFRPVRLKMDAATMGHDEITCTDGGMLSNYPIDIFDRQDGRSARWPTLGIKLSAKQTIDDANWSDTGNSFELAKSLLSTLLTAHDRVHVDDPAVAARTIFVDTTGFSSTDFDLSLADKRALFERGLRSGRRFLASWDWEKWKAGDYSVLRARAGGIE